MIDEGRSQFCIRMPCTDHLWKVDQSRFPSLPMYQDIELVVIAMDESAMSQTKEKGHERGIERGGVRHIVHLTSSSVSAGSCPSEVGQLTMETHR